jgi:hypothetical protein
MKRIISFSIIAMLWAVPVLAFNYSSDAPKAEAPSQESTSATALPPESTQQVAVNFKAESKKLVDAKSRPIDFKAECKKSASDVTKSDINRLSGQIKTQGEEFRKEFKGATDRAEKAEKDRNDEIRKSTEASKDFTGKVQGFKEGVATEAKNLGEQGVKNTALLCGVGALLALFVGVLVLLAVFRSRKSILAAVADVNKNVTDTGEKIIREVPEAVKTLDPEPFVYEIAGNRVRYWAPSDGIKNGFYTILNIEDDDTETDPARMRRKIKSRRGEAIHSVKGTMLKYFGGMLDAKTASLVDFLQNNGNDEIGKIEIIVI